MSEGRGIDLSVSRYREYQDKLISEIRDMFLGKTLLDAQRDNPDYIIHLRGEPMTYQYTEQRVSVSVIDGKIASIDSVG